MESSRKYMQDELSTRTQLLSIYDVVMFRPKFSLLFIALGVLTAVLEGIGAGFVLPVIESVQGGVNSSPATNAFESIYRFIGLPFDIGYILLGLGVIMTVRYTSSFVFGWLRAVLRAKYVRYLRTGSFTGIQNAEIEYFNATGSDEIINAIITQTQYAGRVVQHLVSIFQILVICFVYFLIVVYLSPVLTAFAAVILGLTTFLLRSVFESAALVGDEVAEVNERIQEIVQANTQGIRDAKLFGVNSTLFSRFDAAMDTFVNARVKEERNRMGINNFQQLSAALSVFFVIFVGIEFASLSLGELGVFLFAMFRLSPNVSKLNKKIYRIQTKIPHLVRAKEFIRQAESYREESGTATPDVPITEVEYDDVSFTYEESQEVLSNISFSVQTDEFVGFVGESGAGKSTIVSLLVRMYDPDSGEIRANGTPIEMFDLSEWRDRIAIVRQDPYIFNDTLRENLQIGNEDADQADLDSVAELAKIDEFLESLPEGYDTELGDDGVRLSGGQKQRVALARALLKDADVLVLDEATSDLDTNIENEVQQAIESMNREYIIIGIAHRLSTVEDADRIYVVEDGEIMNIGRHEELLDSGGKYAELY
jgi:subfamily B ATP-binding cassette protein MsbA